METEYGSDPYDPLSFPNRPPSFSGSTQFSIFENNQSAVFAIAASDPDSDDLLSFSIAGPDASKFSVNAVTGEISFIEPPDFESNGSAAGDNSYLLTILVSDGEDSASSSLYIQVLDVYEPPPNFPPVDLLLSSSMVEENLPVGLTVGIFSTVDPDDPGGQGSYLYQLVSDPASAFALDQNGTLKTGVIFDFESQPAHSITVRTTDHHGEWFEKSFSISVIDAFHPVVRTGVASNLTSGTAVLSAQILDPGGTEGLLRKGILVSSTPEPVLGAWDALDFPSNSESADFSVSASGLRSGARHYFRAYAENSEGLSYGSSERLETLALSASPAWADAVAAVEAPNWWSSSWFGSFYKNEDSGWILHSGLGWIFSLPSAQDGVWLWLPERGWLWTASILSSTTTSPSPGLFPWRTTSVFSFTTIASVVGSKWSGGNQD